MELFKLFGTILVDNDKANESISKTDDKAGGLANKFLSGVKTAGKWGAAIVTATAAVGGAMLAMANKSAEAMDQIDKMSNKIGISKKGYQEWKYVLGQNGMEIDKLQTGMKTLVGKMDAVTEGNKSATDTFNKLGLSIYDSSGKMKDQETMMNEAIYALADMENGTEKARLATELFGKSGVEMMPMLNNGSQGIKDLTGRAHELGLVVGDEAVNAGVKFGDTMDDLKQAFGMVGISVGNKLIPIFQKLADWVLAHMPEIRKAINAVSTTVGSVVNIILQILTPALSLISQLIFSSFSFIKDVYNTVLKPVLDAIIVLIQNVLLPIWNIVFSSIAARVRSTFDMINTLWSTSLKPILNGIIDFVSGVFTGNWSQAWEGVKGIVSGVWNGIKTAITSPMRIAMDTVKGIIDSIKSFFNFSISWPHIPLPHFGISPRGWKVGDLLKGRIPHLSIDWYAEGAIFDEPTIFPTAHGFKGVGEAGPEAVAPISELRKYLNEPADQTNRDILDVLLNILNLLSDEDRIRDLIVDILDKAGFNIELDGREVGRIVKKYA